MIHVYEKRKQGAVITHGIKFKICSLFSECVLLIKRAVNMQCAKSEFANKRTL